MLPLTFHTENLKCPSNILSRNLLNIVNTCHNDFIRTEVFVVLFFTNAQRSKLKREKKQKKPTMS